MHVYVINLARSSDRRAHMAGELGKIGLEYELVTAVDGRGLDLDDRRLVDPSFPAYLRVPPGTVTSLYSGSVGCVLSHLQVYSKILADGQDWGLVLEDDVLLPEDLGQLARSAADQLTGAEIAMLSYDSPNPCQMSPQGAVPLTGGRLLALPVDIRQPRSCGAYVITREACERMVKSVLPVRVQADGWWFYYREGIVDRVRCVTPLPVLKNPRLTSTIGSYSLSTGWKARVADQLLRRRIPGLHQALSYRRKRIYRQWARSELVDVPFVERPSRLD